MKFKLYSLMDQKAGVFLQPFVARNEHDMRRTMAAAFEDPQFNLTPAGRYPHEFLVYCIGQFDDESGIVDSILPIRIATLSDLRPLPPASTVPS